MDLATWKFGQTPIRPPGHGDELREYLSAELAQPWEDPREWWLAHESRFPILCKMAFDILSIPAMSAEPERVFSGYSSFHAFKLILRRAKNLINDSRNRLVSETIEATECYRSWVQRKFLADKWDASTLQ
jgi:hypothetical protein